MAHAIRFEKAGGPDVLSWLTVEVGKPGQGQVRLRHTAVGLNYIDTYQRSGLYPMPVPSGLGSEAAGVIEEVGPGVSGLKPGDRVAYSGGPIGAYADERVMPADRLVPLPEGITDQQAAAMMLKGMTAWYLVRRTHPVKPRRDDPDPRRGGRGRPHRLPMGETSRRHRNRHGRRRRKGGARQTERLRLPDPLQTRGFRRQGRRADPGEEAARRLRFGWKGYLLQVSRLPGAARAHGVVRAIFGGGRTRRLRHPRCQRLTLPDPADFEYLHGDP